MRLRVVKRRMSVNETKEDTLERVLNFLARFVPKLSLIRAALPCTLTAFNFHGVTDAI